MLTQPYSLAGASNKPKITHRFWDKNPICFRVEGLHANSYHTPSTQNNSTTKQALGEAARVRRDPDRAQRLDENFTLWQRVKMRLAEPVDALL